MNSSLVVIDDDHEVAQLGERRGGTEIENGRRAFKRRVPEFLSVEIVREEAKTGDVDIHALTVGDGNFRAETVLPMTAAGRMAGRNREFT